MNTIGKYFRLTTFGESHGPAMGGILDGMPPGVKIDPARLQAMIDRRRTGRSTLTSQRRETDVAELLSGINPEGLSLGTPIGFIFRNTDARSGDYAEIERRYRPNHADYAYIQRYGLRDARGGGRSSARETVSWVMGGALAAEWLAPLGITVEARLTQVGKYGYTDPFATLRENPAEGKLPFSEATEEEMLGEVERAKMELDSVGGRVSCVVRGVPAGLGSPVFGKVQARMAEAMMSLNAAKSFEYGMGREAAEMRGSESLDLFNPGFSPMPLQSNFGGGMAGGITTGMPIYFSVSFKPTPTLGRPLPMPDAEGEIAEVAVKGRHDPCVAMRAPVIVESLAWMVMADLMVEAGAAGWIPARP